MAFVTMVSTKDKLDGSIKKQVFDFLRKLQDNDAAPGLHIEPMKGARDRRARTGKVNDMWRAVLFRMEVPGETHYVYIGTWPHDKANAIAESSVMTFNSALGVPEIINRGAPNLTAEEPTASRRRHDERATAKPSEAASADAGTPPVAVPTDRPWANPLCGQWDASSLSLQAGIDAEPAEQALAASTASEFTAVVNACPEVQGLVLLGLAQGDDLATVRSELGLSAAPMDVTDDGEDVALVRGLKTAPLGFAYVGENPQELRDAVESADIDQWRIFLHPEQRQYVTKATNGAYRLSGGAGTGKTVVLLHRARHLAERDTDRRVLLTTFTRTLADSLATNMGKLAPGLDIVTLGEPGVAIFGIDQIAYRILAEASIAEKETAHQAVFGTGRNAMTKLLGREQFGWKQAAASVEHGLDAHLVEPAFLAQEYLAVVLAGRITSLAEYVKVSRPGRGTALNRKARMGLWKIVEAFRRENELEDQLTYAEQTVVAAAVLEGRAAGGQTLPTDSVLVDEAQDLHAGHWQLLRALVPEGPDDLFIAEDSHQRIYGQKISLSRFGIKIRGRARRLRLNYRTTAENLAYAISILSGQDYLDLEGGEENTNEYHSVRSGPEPLQIGATDLHSELDAAVQHLHRWKEQEVPGNAIGILARSEKTLKSIHTGLLEREIQAQVVTARTKRPQPDQPLLMTMHSAKGMEFQNVIVMGVGDGELPATWDYDKLPEAEQADAVMRERSLLYVAASRARDELVVTWAGAPSRLLGNE
ncbi:3'-5' exonuclease [Arthrobacter rhombi]|uniref:3'-5' exonuclease n=1 Tax=Arthrobacter rhombi TaxID=71253 RepID=UPI003FCEFFAD